MLAAIEGEPGRAHLDLAGVHRGAELAHDPLARVGIGAGHHLSEPVSVAVRPLPGVHGFRNHREGGGVRRRGLGGARPFLIGCRGRARERHLRGGRSRCGHGRRCGRCQARGQAPHTNLQGGLTGGQAIQASADVAQRVRCERRFARLFTGVGAEDRTEREHPTDDEGRPEDERPGCARAHRSSVRMSRRRLTTAREIPQDLLEPSVR